MEAETAKLEVPMRMVVDFIKNSTVSI
jgi:hypothetical protein